MNHGFGFGLCVSPIKFAKQVSDARGQFDEE